MSDAPPRDGPVMRATPYEYTDAYQNLYRRENRRQRSTHFTGVVGTSDKLVLTTNVGDHARPTPLELMLMPTGRPDFSFGAAAPSKPSGGGIGGLFSRGMRMNSIRGAVQRPIDSFLRMTIVHPGGRWEGIYTNGNSRLKLPIDVDWRPVPLTCTIELANANPINPVWFAFAVYWLGANG